MKRLLSVCLTLIMVLSLFGCKSDKNLIDDVEKLSKKLEGKTQKEVEKILGVPDSVLSGLFGDCYINSKGNEVVVYYSPEGKVSNIQEYEPVYRTEPEPEPEPDPRIPDTSKAHIYENNPKLTPVNYDSPALLCISEDMGQEYVDKMVFICDSPTYWMKPYGLLSGGKETTQIWTGPTGTQTFPYYKGYKLLDPYDNTEKLVVNMAKEHQPEIMVIALGINGIAKRSEDSFTSIYKNLVEDLMDASPNSTVICMSIYPISPKYKRWDIINNEVITRGNSWIMNVCNQTGAYYLDAAAALLGEDGNVIPELSKEDGFHPNKEGLEKVLEYIRTHAFYAERTTDAV